MGLSLLLSSAAFFAGAAIADTAHDVRARISHVVANAGADAADLVSLAALELARYSYLLDASRGAVPIVSEATAFAASLLQSRSTTPGTRVVIVDLSTAAPSAASRTLLSASVCEYEHLLGASGKPADPALDTTEASTRRQSYVICPAVEGVQVLAGASPVAALYAVYDYLGRLGVSFTTASPVLPVPGARTALAGLPPSGVGAQPIFPAKRGLQPFHDFSEGPDWWSEDEYKRVIEGIAQMRGNVIAMHTYPVAGGAMGSGPTEPAVWVGLAESVNADGTVTSAYDAAWSTTHRTAWGYTPLNTSAFSWGASVMYEHECFGHPVQSGLANLCPAPATPADQVALFDGVGALWQAVFPFAHALGVQTILGTETPITPPPPPGNRLVALQVWYSASRDDHFVTTTDCTECMDLYVLLGYAGAVYASNASDPSLVPLTTWYSGVYEDNILVAGAGAAPPDASYGFVRVEGFASAAAAAAGSGSGDDAATLPLQQSTNGRHHWAVAGPGWIANATAAGFTVDPTPMALVWPAAAPLPTAQEWYEGTFTRLQRLLGDSLDYYWVWTPEGWEWQKVDINDPLVQDVVADTQAMQAAATALNVSFALAACGWVVGPLGARWYFDTVLPSSWFLSSIDMQVGNTPVDPAYANVTHRDALHKVFIPWSEDDPGLTVPELWVNRTLLHEADAVAYGVGGMLNIHWRTRADGPTHGASHAWAWDQSITAASWWATWATGQFSAAVGAAAGAIFTAIDSYALPRPVSWIGGPGGLAPGGCSAGQPAYAWVDAFLALRAPLVAAVGSGAATLAHLEAFDFWAYSVSYMRGVDAFQCEWSRYNAAIAAIQAITDPAQRQQAAVTAGFAARVSLVGNLTLMMTDMVSSTTGIEGAGTLHNLITHSLPGAVGDAPTALLQALAGGTPLPAAAFPPADFDATRAPSLRMPSPRTILAPGEPLRVRAWVLATPAQAPRSVALYTRPLGSGAPYTSTPLAQAAPEGGVPRLVYTGALPAVPAGGLEYYVQALLPGNATAYTGGLGIPAGTAFAPGAVICSYPPTAPAVPATVIVAPSGAARGKGSGHATPPLQLQLRLE